ncbi:unnamed protein product [Orchesella dallaii]|uniref:PHD-type domain-containing protein n=1 Tax=Orchesella dallaii TaxID=48710 RepID=A0ABP1Q334_9HEXA
MHTAQYRKVSEEPNWVYNLCETEKQACCISSTIKKQAHCITCTECLQQFHTACLKRKLPAHKPEDLMWKCPNCIETPMTQLNPQPSLSHQACLPLLEKAKGISIGHINARDILSNHKKDDIYNIVSSVPFHIFGVSETWLYDGVHTNEVHIPGYQTVRRDRKYIKNYRSRGGGLLLYVQDD